MSGRRFSEVSSVEPLGGGTYLATIDRDWSVGGVPNGGYLLATMARAACAEAVHPVPLVAAAEYVRPVTPGDARIEAAVLRAGRSMTHVSATMVQGDEVCVSALFGLSGAEALGPLRWSRGLPKPDAAPIDSCSILAPATPSGVPATLMDQVEVRLEQRSTGWTESRPSGQGQLQAWLALPGDEPADPISLLCLVDVLPPATFDLPDVVPGWIPTVMLQVNIRAMPAPGPVMALQQARAIGPAHVDEACTIWDRNGALVAHATQLAGVRQSASAVP